MTRNLLLVPLLLMTCVVLAGDTQEADLVADTPETKPETRAPEPEENVESTEGPKMVSGMSILGNQEAPKSLVIVPWKSSEIGDSLGISTMLDDSRQPIDREVFMRALSYYEIRSDRTP